MDAPNLMYSMCQKEKSLLKNAFQTEIKIDERFLHESSVLKHKNLFN